jgi:flagellar biosynthesis protein FlhF
MMDQNVAPDSADTGSAAISATAFDEVLERESEREPVLVTDLKPSKPVPPPVPVQKPGTGSKTASAPKPVPVSKPEPEAPPKAAKALKVSKVPAALGAAAYRKVQNTPASRGDLASELSLEREIAALREFVGEEIGELKNLFWDLAHRQSLSEKWRDRPEVVSLYRALLGTGLSPQWAREFSEKSVESQDAWGGELVDHLRQTIKPRIRVLGSGAPLPRLIALTGPTGAGKTTSLVRLAAWSQKNGRKVSIITLDTLKLGGVEQLARYARIMGLGLKACQNKAEFDEANEIFQESDLVLIDTNTRDFTVKGATDDLGAALMEAGAKRLLVLPAGLKTEDLESLYRAMAGPALLGVVLTKLDETMGLGNVMGFLAGHGPALGFFSVGARTPEDFVPASADKLLDYWLAPLIPRESNS